MPSLRPFLFLPVLLMPALALGASGAGAVLKGTPFAHMSDDDYARFFATAERAANGTLGETLEWAGDNGQSHGTVKAVRAFERTALTCRELRGHTTAGAKTEPYRLTVCKADDGQWRLATSEPRRKPVAAPSPTR